MPSGPSLIPTNLTIIMQAVEQQLLGYVSPVTGNAIVGDISNVYWVEVGDEPPPAQTGQRDILLAMLPDVPTNVQGAMRFTEIKSGLTIYLRSTLAADRRGTKRDWMIAHRLLVDAMMDAMMDFFPVDANENALTIEGFVIGDEGEGGEGNAAPTRAKVAPGNESKKTTWGQTVGTYRFHYIPNITLTTLDPTVAT
jgi:hypothetical protein